MIIVTRPLGPKFCLGLNPLPSHTTSLTLLAQGPAGAPHRSYSVVQHAIRDGSTGPDTTIQFPFARHPGEPTPSLRLSQPEVRLRAANLHNIRSQKKHTPDPKQNPPPKINLLQESRPDQLPHLLAASGQIILREES